MAGQEPQPARLGTDPEQRLGHRESQQLSVGQPGRPPMAGGLAQVIVDLDVECGQKGVQVGRHKLILNTLRPSSDIAWT
jgi:hypothetical protein